MDSVFRSDCHTWPVRLINLAVAQERLAWQRAQFEELGIAFELRPGINGKQFSQEDLDRVTGDPRDRLFKRALTPSEVGCYIAHILNWREIAAGPHKVVIVFEDDVELGPEAGRQLANMAQSPPEWDVLKLCYGDTKPDLYSDCPSAALSRKLPPTTLGYAITRAAAAVLVEKAFPISRPVDIDLKHWWEHGLCVKVAEPALGWHQPCLMAASKIEAERSNYRVHTGLLKRFLANARYQATRRAMALKHFGKTPVNRKAVDVGPRNISLHPFLAHEPGY